MGSLGTLHHEAAGTVKGLGLRVRWPQVRILLALLPVTWVSYLSAFHLYL